jgi:hypothetical protein
LVLTTSSYGYKQGVVTVGVGVGVGNGVGHFRLKKYGSTANGFPEPVNATCTVAVVGAVVVLLKVNGELTPGRVSITRLLL